MSTNATRSLAKVPTDKLANWDDVGQNGNVAQPIQPKAGRRQISQSPRTEPQAEVQSDNSNTTLAAHDEGSRSASVGRSNRHGSYGVAQVLANPHPKMRENNTSRDIPAAPSVPIRGHPRSSLLGQSNLEARDTSPSAVQDTSWLGDGVSDAEEQKRALTTSEREQARAPEKGGQLRTTSATYVNGRPTRSANKRHAVLQQRAEEMEPGEPRDRAGRPVAWNGGGPAERVPRRDWAVPTDERQRRLVIDLAAERAAQMRSASGLVQSPVGWDGVSSPHGEGGPSVRSQPPGSRGSSHPNSRRQSGQGSVASGPDGSEGDEGTTALPRMQYRSAAAALGKEIGVSPGERGGGVFAEGEGRTDGNRDKRRDSSRDKSMLDKLGFGKKKKQGG